MRYYFHLRIGDTTSPDEIGLELPDVDTAYLEAFRAAQEVWTELLDQRSDPLLRTFEIANADGQVVLTLPFSEVLDRARRPKRPPSSLPAEELLDAHPVPLGDRPQTPSTGVIIANDESAECIERARVCRERGVRRSDGVYLRLEQSWMLLSQSHEVVRHASSFIEQLRRSQAARHALQPL